MRQEFIRFLLVGATNTLFSYALYLFLITFLTYFHAYSIAYCLGIVLSYFLNVQFVFKKRVSFKSFLSFPIVYLIQYILGAFMLWLLVENLSISPEFAMIVVILVTIPITFIFSRFVLKN